MWQVRGAFSVKKKMNVKRVALTILQAAAMAIRYGLVPKQEIGGGYRLRDLAVKVSELTRQAFGTRQVVKAMRVWFHQNLAKFNNKHLQLTKRGEADLWKYAPV